MAKKKAEEAPARATRERLPRAAKDRAARVAVRKSTPTPEPESEPDAVTSPLHAAAPKVASKLKPKTCVTEKAPARVATPALMLAPEPVSRAGIKTHAPVSKSDPIVTPTSKDLPFRFLSLPAEIRNMVYRLLLDYSSSMFTSLCR
jgi:hypothetical protein